MDSGKMILYADCYQIIQVNCKTQVKRHSFLFLFPSLSCSGYSDVRPLEPFRELTVDPPATEEEEEPPDVNGGLEALTIVVEGTGLLAGSLEPMPAVTPGLVPASVVVEEGPPVPVTVVGLLEPAT